MSATFISLFILASSGALLFFWLRSACRCILSEVFEQQHKAGVAEVTEFEYLVGHKLLRENPEEIADRCALMESLEREYKFLSYLLGKTTSLQGGQHPYRMRLLRLDFQLLRLWLRLKVLLTVDNWGASLLEMGAILRYFGDALSQRLRSSMQMFEPCPVLAGGAPSSLLCICTYCRDVRLSPDTSKEKWVTAKRYFQLGGKGSVSLSHGICPQCYKLVRGLMLTHQ